MGRFLGLRGASLNFTISCVCGLCFLCFGYAQGVLGGLLTVPSFLARFPQVDTVNNLSAHNAKIQGITVATWNIGCFVSAVLTIFLGDLLGRKKVLLLGLTLWAIGEIIQCSSFSYGQFIAGRFIAGFGNGFTTATVPAYQAECVKSHRRGTILMISAGSFISFGLALSYWLTFGFAYLSDTHGSLAWRFPIAFQILFAVVAFCLIIFLPESPRWLILTGREQEALVVLSALNNEHIDGPEIREEFLQIKDAILIMSSGSASSMASNKERRNLHRAVLAYLVQVFQQVSGINLALQYFSLMFLKQMGYTGWVARLLGACAATEYFLASFIAVIGIDRFWGRRSLMMFGSAGMSGCMALLCVFVYLWQVQGIRGTNIAASVFLFGFATFFAIGWQGMAWLYQVEIVPLRIRGPANALSTSGNWLFNFVIVLIAPIAFHYITWRTYIIFAATNFAIIPLVYFLYPETAYRTLEEVDVIFQIANEAPGNPWFNVVKISQQEPLWFGRKGDVPFDYEQSEWHKRHMAWGESGTTLGTGRATNEKAAPPSPIDGDGGVPALPVGHAFAPSSHGLSPGDTPDSSPTGTMTSNAPLHPGINYTIPSNPISQIVHQKVHKSKSFATSSTAPVGYKSYREYHSPVFARLRPLNLGHDADGDRDVPADWRHSVDAPPPLRVPSRDSVTPMAPAPLRRESRDRSEGYRPGTAGSATTAISQRSQQWSMNAFGPSGVATFHDASPEPALADDSDVIRGNNSRSSSFSRPNSRSAASPPFAVPKRSSSLRHKSSVGLPPPPAQEEYGVRTHESGREIGHGSRVTSGLHRTESGRETYYPSGIRIADSPEPEYEDTDEDDDEDEEDDDELRGRGQVSPRRRMAAGRQSDSSRYAARDAGRGF